MLSVANVSLWKRWRCGSCLEESGMYVSRIRLIFRYN